LPELTKIAEADNKLPTAQTLGILDCRAPTLAPHINTSLGNMSFGNDGGWKAPTPLIANKVDGVTWKPAAHQVAWSTIPSLREQEADPTSTNLKVVQSMFANGLRGCGTGRAASPAKRAGSPARRRGGSLAVGNERALHPVESNSPAARGNGRGPNFVHVAPAAPSGKPEWQVPSFKGNISRVHVSMRDRVLHQTRAEEL
jgi:hypothetical protein